LEHIALHHVNIGVQDIDSARAFYTGVLGLREVETLDGRADSLWLEVGSSQLRLSAEPDHEPHPQPHFAIEVPDLDVAVASLRSSGVKAEELPTAPNGDRQALLHDPSGNLIEIRRSASHAALSRTGDDKQAIHDVVLRYCRAVDQRDFELLRTCFHRDAVARYSTFEGDRDGLVAWLRQILEGVVATMHVAANHYSDVSGDTARVETYTVSYAIGDEGKSRINGVRYLDRFERREGGWAIVDRTVAIRFSGRAPELRAAPALVAEPR
jgi:catechol 2,3-dioxygenase-like lactoylglutathione lyase family enzyme